MEASPEMMEENMDVDEQDNMEQEVPIPRIPKEGLHSTPFAPAYRSIFTLTPPANKLLHLLEYVNCSYLSTPGVPPSLLQLKQHAQALTILIKQLTVSTSSGIIDNANIPTVSEMQFENKEDVEAEFRDGETYDWLNDLTKPYWGPKSKSLRRHHELPLTNLLNLLQQEEGMGKDGQKWMKILD